MPTIQLKINAAASEDSLAALSTEFPDDEFKILASHTTDDGLLGIVEVTTLDGDTLARHFDESPGVRSSEVVYTDERTVLIQYVIPIPDSYRVVRASGNLTRFPVLMRDGWLFAERTASHERLAQYTDELAAAGMTDEISEYQSISASVGRRSAIWSKTVSSNRFLPSTFAHRRSSAKSVKAAKSTPPPRSSKFRFFCPEYPHAGRDQLRHPVR